MPDYFDIVTTTYNVFGLKAGTTPIRKYIFFYLLLPLEIVMYAMVLINFKYQKDVYGILEVFESTSSFGQLLIRKVTMVMYFNQIDKIIKNRPKFWSLDVCGKPIGATLGKKTQFQSIFIKVYVMFGAFSIVFIVGVIPLFSKEKMLPSSCWVPHDSNVLFVAIYILQAIGYVELNFTVKAIDAFFLFICTDVEIQFKLIIRMLRGLKIGLNGGVRQEQQVFLKLVECSNHHKVLLRVHKSLSEIFSTYFFIELLLNISAVTIQFYVLTNVSADIEMIIKCLIYIATVMLLDCISFLPASNVEIEGENLANEIYSVEWYNTPNMKIRKFILFWLMKAQEPLQMKAGGLMTVNRNIFLQVPKTSFSINTLLS